MKSWRKGLLNWLKNRVTQLIHHFMRTIMNENHNEITGAFPEGSFARLFWEEQLKAARVKDPRQMRWHPLMIKWCLNLKLISSAAFHAVQSSGFLWLPSKRMLRDFTHYVKSQQGFYPELNTQLQKEAGIDSVLSSKRFVVLLMDEMKIKDLVHDKHTGEIVGLFLLGTLVKFSLNWKRSALTAHYEYLFPPIFLLRW